MNIGFYFLCYNNKNHSKWLELLQNVSSFANEIHIITDHRNSFKISNSFKENSLDLSKKAFSMYMTKRIMNDIDPNAVDSCKKIMKISRHFNFGINAYLNVIAQKWDYIIETNNLDAIYLMEPLNVPYNPVVIILEALCAKKNVLFGFLRSSFIHYNVELHNCLRRVKKDRLRNCYKTNYWNNIDQKQVVLRADDFKKSCLEFMRSDEFLYSVTKGNQQIERALNKNKDVNFNFKYILLLLTKANNPREIYVTTSFMDKVRMIRELSNSLPTSYKLVVKDHPHNIIKKNKSINNVQKVTKSLENVMYVDSGFTTLDLVAESDIVISTTSHSAYQALFQDKKVALFSDNLFLFGKEKAPVFRLRSYNGLKQRIEEIIEKNAPIKEINRLMYLLSNSVSQTGFYGADRRDINDRYCKMILDDCSRIYREDKRYVT